MEKLYLAGFGKPLRTDTVHLCKGYFMALRDDGFLRGKIHSGFTPVGADDESFKTFSKMYGKDVVLWERLCEKAKECKQDFLTIVRAEVKSVNYRVVPPRFQILLGHLENRFSPLEFAVYTSDIENKS